MSRGGGGRDRWRRRRALSGGWRRWVPWAGDADGGRRDDDGGSGRWRRRRGSGGRRRGRHGGDGGGGRRRRRWPRLISLALLVAAGLVALGTAFLWVTLPDPLPLASGWPETTAYIEMRKTRARAEGRELEVRWEPVPLASIPDHVKRAVRVAEDAMFYRHHGIDWYEVWMAIEGWWSEDERPRGASTITMQLARNLYLSPERSFLRKARESLIALRLERRLSKARILELYLNVVELGPGVFGVEAAARHYWRTSVGGLGRREAAELAATLPSPRDDNPRTRTREFLWRVGLVRGRAFGADTADVDAADTAAAGPAPSDSLPGGRLPPDSVRPSLPGGTVGDTAGPPADDSTGDG